ncbi:MAG: hypothetical protein ACQEP3_01945 [Patescibacteria group bacterium]
MNSASLFFGIPIIIFGLGPGLLLNNQVSEIHPEIILKEAAQEKIQREVQVKDIDDDYIAVEFMGTESKIKLKEDFKAYLDPVSEKREYLKKRADNYEGDCPEIKPKELEQFNIRKINPEEAKGKKAAVFFTFNDNNFVVTHLIIET